jgi:hypothetical protein
MKRIIVLVVVMLTAFLSQAAEPSSLERGKDSESRIRVANIENPFAAECSVTMKGTINLGPIEAEVSCTTTAPTCNKATMMAVNCLSAAVKTVRAMIM